MPNDQNDINRIRHSMLDRASEYIKKNRFAKGTSEEEINYRLYGYIDNYRFTDHDGWQASELFRFTIDKFKSSDDALNLCVIPLMVNEHDRPHANRPQLFDDSVELSASESTPKLINEESTYKLENSFSMPKLIQE